MATSSLTAATYSGATLHAITRGTRSLADSIYRLSSGNRYVPGEDSSSLSLATQLQANAASFRQGLKNSTQASSLLAIAANGLSQIRERLASARATAAAAQSETLTEAERIYLQTSLDSDLAAIDDLAASTRFNSIDLLNGDLSETDGGENLTFTIGTGADALITIELRDASTDRLLGGTTPSLLSAGDADDAVDALDDAEDLLDADIARLGGNQSRVDYAADHLTSQIYGQESAAGELSDIDVTEESTRYRLQFIIQKSAYAVLAQSRNLNGGLLGLLNFSTQTATTPTRTFSAQEE